MRVVINCTDELVQYFPLRYHAKAKVFGFQDTEKSFLNFQFSNLVHPQLNWHAKKK